MQQGQSKKTVVRIEYGSLLNGNFYVGVFYFKDKDNSFERVINCGNEYYCIDDAMIVANALSNKYNIESTRWDQVKPMDECIGEIDDRFVRVL